MKYLNNLQTDHFDYSSIDKETSEMLQAKVYKIEKITNKSAYEIGKELKGAQERLAKKGYGVFEEWFRSLGFKKTKAYQYINHYEFVCSESERSNIEKFESLPKSLQIEIAKPSANKGLNQKALDGNITSHSQYKEQERIIKQQEERIKELENKEPEIIEKEIFKEIPVKPHDYEGLKSDNKQLSAALKDKQSELEHTNERNQFIEKQYKEVLEDRKDDLNRKEKLEKMQMELERLAKRKNKMSDQIDTIKQLTSLKYEVDKMLEKISPFFFNQTINSIRQDRVLEQSFMETVNSVQMWCDSMHKLIGTQNTIEGEIIND